MALPKPNYSFVIPSVYDGRKLECRIFLPPVFQNIQSTTSWHISGAIVAHPYAPLGGCYNDPVVNFISSELLHANYVVGTFNFRGAGDSEGRTSWTSKPELGDYVSFYGFMLQYLHFLRLTLASTRSAPESQANQAEGVPEGQSQESIRPAENAGIRLILGGYSYGSLIASHLPTLEVMLNLFRSPMRSETPTPISEIRNTAKGLSTSSLEHLQPSPIEDPDLHALTTISYLLVSPLLPPVSNLLTIFTTLSLKVQGSSQSQTLPCPNPADQLSTHRSLALAGNLDSFVSATKLEKWSDEITHMPGSQFQFRMIDGADHFWRDNERARLVLRVWLFER